MGEAAIDPKVYAKLTSLPPSLPFSNRALFCRFQPGGCDAQSVADSLSKHYRDGQQPRVEFFEKFDRAADDHDRNFIKKYDEDLNTTLIFAGLFSAVTSAFIVDVQSKLEPDFEEMNHALLKIIANSALGNIPTGADAAFPVWNGPDSTIVRVQAILYSSLSASLLAAFVAMLGKQWLNRYSSVERGSIIDRGRQRKRKMDGMVAWKFALVMECLPLMLRDALLLLGYALSDYLFFINKAVAGVIIGFTTFGLLFYSLVISAATFSYDCPFQVPLSLIFRYLIRFDSEHKKCLKRSRKWFGRIFSQMRKWPRPRLSGPYGLGTFSTFDGNPFGNHVEVPMANTPVQSPPLFNKETNWDGFVLDSSCIVWMFEMSMDMDITMAIVRAIPEIVWHSGIPVTPLERLYDTVLECFDYSSGHPVVIPKLRSNAYFSAKALLHLAIQRKCIGGESDEAMFKSILDRHMAMGSMHYEGESDLEATLGIIDYVFGSFEPTYWQDFTFTIQHHAWMGHILLYRAWDIINKGNPLPDDIQGFILYSLQLVPPPPAPIVADCLLIVGLVLGINLHVDDLLVVDKSREVNSQINRIYAKLTETFRNPTPITAEIDHALEALELIVPLSKAAIALKSYDLFHVIMQVPISPIYSQEKKWEASRLAMHGAYKWDGSLPWVEDPQDILTFLNHHFDLVTESSQNQHQPIQDALRALAYTSGPVAIEVLKCIDPTEPSFVRGICYAFQGDRPFELRKAALFFLPLISDRRFNTPHPIMEHDQMRSLCVDWASTVDDVEHTCEIQVATVAVLVEMISSSHWRPYIVTDKWIWLQYFTSLPDDSEPLWRCIDNSELMDVIRDVKNPCAMQLWLAVLWLNYTELIPQVQEQLETATKEIAQDSTRSDLEVSISIMISQLDRTKDGLTQYPEWSTDPAAIALQEKMNNLIHAWVSLLTLKGEL